LPLNNLYISHVSFLPIQGETKRKKKNKRCICTRRDYQEKVEDGEVRADMYRAQGVGKIEVRQ
jgi:transcriptional regulator with GAF, ATPase, and Fis domain